MLFKIIEQNRGRLRQERHESWRIPVFGYKSLLCPEEFNLFSPGGILGVPHTINPLIYTTL